ncbi:MAG: tellurite resistance TerB family protein [Hyphomicrobiaceae bacterium]
MSTLSPEEGLIYAMLTTAAVDGRITDDELFRIGSIVKELPPFLSYDHEWLVNEARDCSKVLAGDGGLDSVLDLIVGSLPKHLEETAYVLCAEVAATDLKVRVEEIRFLELLAGRLKLDKLICAALERSAKARHQKIDPTTPTRPWLPSGQ